MQSWQDAGEAEDFQVPEEGAPYYTGLIDVTDITSWESMYKLTKSCTIPSLEDSY